MAVVYFVITAVFVWKSMSLLPIWLTAKDKATEAQIDYERKLERQQKEEQAEKSKTTDLGKERYQKEFFNKLDEKENLIILYGKEEEQTPDELERKMFWWEKWEQEYYVWWRNLKLLKN
jgi:hypothetical protein